MNKKIKIAYIIDELNIGGTEKQLLKTIELLDNEKLEPIMICLRPSEYYSNIDIPCEKHILNVYSLVSVHCLLKLLWFVFYLRKHRIDIVQTYFVDANMFGVLAAYLANVKTIISCRRDMGFWYKPGIFRILRVLNKLTSRFLVNSNSVKRHICKYESIPSLKVDVIYNGVATDLGDTPHDGTLLKHKLNIRNDDYVVGTVANLNRSVKRVDVFLKAAAEVLRNLENVIFLIVGEGHLKGELGKLSEDLKIENKVIFAGLIEDVSPYISLFDVGVISSDSEGFSNSILEYMALGVPVVATDGGGNREVVKEGETGLLVTVGNYKWMAEKICTLLKKKNKNRRLQMGKNGTIFVKQKYSWDKKIKEIETYYHSVLGDEIKKSRS